MVTLKVSKVADIDDELQFLEMEDTLQRLKTYRTDLADITLMKVYGAMTNEDIAHVMDKTPDQVKYAWKAARLWLVDSIQLYAH